MQQLAIGISEAASRLGIGRSLLYKIIGKGEIRPRKIGNRTVILVSELEAWISRVPVDPQPPGER